MGANIKSMTLEQARAYRDKLKKQGKSESTSKEYAKVSDYIKVLKSQAGEGDYGDKELASAYTNLSRGVTKAGGWTEKNAENIYKYTGKYPTFTQDAQGNPIRPAGESGDLSSYLNGYQDTVFGASSNPEVRDNIINQIEPEGGIPEPVDWSEMYDEMRENAGVTELENMLNDLTAQREEEMAITEERVLDAEGKPVPMGVISGRITEIDRQQTRRIDAINRQINTITNQLNTAYNVIQTYMQFERMEYQDAVDRYNTEFNRNLQIYKLIDEEMDEQLANARANLQTYQNLIVSGNMSWDDLDNNQKSFIHRLEVQAGLPVGFVSSLGMSFKDRLLGTSADGTQAWMLDENGNMQVVSTGLKPSGSGSSGGESISTYTYMMEDAIREANKQAKGMGISYEGDMDMWITPKQAEPLIEEWKRVTGRSENDWWARFGKYVIQQ